MIYLLALGCFVFGAVSGGVFVFVRVTKALQKHVLASVNADQKCWRMAGGRAVLEQVHHQVVDHGRDGDDLRQWLRNTLDDYRKNEIEYMIEIGQQAIQETNEAL